MAVRKYNYPELRLEFFASPINEVKGFFQDKFNTYNASIREKTKWWTNEKKEYQMEQVKKAELVYEKERQQKWTKVLRNMDTARMAWLQQLWERLVNSKVIKEMQVREIVEALKHMRLEIWETTENVKETDNLSILEKLHNEHYWKK